MNTLPDQLASVVFQRVIREDIGQVSLDTQTLNFFVEVDGKKTAEEIAAKIGVDYDKSRAIAEKLLRLKLIEPLQPSERVVDADFIDYLQRQLSMAIGPIAGVILEDTLADLGHSSDALPVHRAAELVELLAREIQRDEQRIEFKQRLVKMIMQKGYSA
ncbi:MAG: hypothetical protein K9L59_09665 [Desulfobacterales bacterium]|nr:hypothetical protein [Desulfobacterales bacterium]